MKTTLILGSIFALSVAGYAQNASYCTDACGITSFNNSAFGVLALSANITGNHNAATGSYAMLNNTTGSYNSAHGMNAMRFNISGYSNSATGSTALYNNISGFLNTSNGDESMRQNISGSYNAANGHWALYNNIDGDHNTGTGHASMFSNVSGFYVTGLGSGSDVGAPGLKNVTAIGANAIVMANDNMILGDNSVNVGIGLSGVAGGPGNKLEINTAAASPIPGASGLRFTDLTNASSPMPNPGMGVLSVDANGDVIYVRDCCFSAKDAGTTNPGVMDELKAQAATIAKQQQQIDELKAIVQSLAGIQTKSNVQTVNMGIKNQVILNQNAPNPFAESTVISYNIPGDFSKAQVVFSTADGKAIKTVDVFTKGPGSLNIFGDDLSHGVYTYSLIVDGKVIDTKKMIKE